MLHDGIYRSASLVCLLGGCLNSPGIAAVEAGDRHLDFHFASRDGTFVFRRERIAAEVPRYLEGNVVSVHFAIGDRRGGGRRRSVAATAKPGYGRGAGKFGAIGFQV